MDVQKFDTELALVNEELFAVKRHVKSLTQTNLDARRKHDEVQELDAKLAQATKRTESNKLAMTEWNHKVTASAEKLHRIARLVCYIIFFFFFLLF
jgi:hypothetical protein